MSANPDSSPDRPRRGEAILLIVLVAAVVAAISGAQTGIRTWLQSRRDANERAAIQTILQMNTALYKYRQAHADEYPKSLGEVPEVEPLMKCGKAECQKSGYRFKYELLAPTNMGPRYAILVRPNKYRNTGTRSFYSDESGVVRATNDDRAASAGDGPVL